MIARWPLVLLAACVGCGSAEVNPYAQGTRPDGVTLAGSPLRLVLRVDPDQAEAVQAAVQEAVDSVGQGTVAAFDGPARSGLLHMARTTEGSELNADVASYEVTFVARIRNSLAPMSVVWRNGTRMVVGKQVRLLDLGTNRYQLLFNAPPGKLVVSGGDLIRQDEGYRFKRAQFQLLKQDGKRIPLRVVSEVARLRPEHRLLFLEVGGFTGDVNGLLNALLSQDVGGVRFDLVDTHLWLVAGVVPEAAPEPEEEPEPEPEPGEDDEETEEG